MCFGTCIHQQRHLTLHMRCSRQFRLNTRESLAPKDGSPIVGNRHVLRYGANGEGHFVPGIHIQCGRKTHQLGTVALRTAACLLQRKPDLVTNAIRMIGDSWLEHTVPAPCTTVAFTMLCDLATWVILPGSLKMWMCSHLAELDGSQVLGSLAPCLPLAVVQSV